MAVHNNPWEGWLIDLAGISLYDYEQSLEPQRTERIEETYAILKEWSGQDFGYSPDAWRNWMMSHPTWDENPEREKRFNQSAARKQAQVLQNLHRSP